MTTAAPPLLVVAGATATGKTGLAIRLAEWIAGQGRPAEIISADSRQVFRGLDIGTAKVSAAERARVPHHGLDLVDPDEPFSVADFVRHARTALAGIAERDGVAILAGGTGLYLRAVARGLDADALPSDPEVRARLEAELSTNGLDPLVERLRRLAPTRAAQIDLRNPRRVVRALEIAELQGDAGVPEPLGYDGPVAWLGLTVEPGDPRTLDRRAGTRPVRCRAHRGGPCAARAVRSVAAVLLGDRLSRVVGGARRRTDAGGRDRARREAQRGLREAAADLVPLGARDRMARRDAATPCLKPSRSSAGSCDGTRRLAPHADGSGLR